MEYRLLVVVIAILAVSCQNCNPNVATQQLIWDGATSVSGVPLNALMCVKDTQIDFMVPQSTVANLPVTSLTGGATTYQNLRFVLTGLIGRATTEEPPCNF